MGDFEKFGTFQHVFSLCTNYFGAFLFQFSIRFTVNRILQHGEDVHSVKIVEQKRFTLVNEWTYQILFGYKIKILFLNLHIFV